MQHDLTFQINYASHLSSYEQLFRMIKRHLDTGNLVHLKNIQTIEEICKENCISKSKAKDMYFKLKKEGGLELKEKEGWLRITTV